MGITVGMHAEVSSLVEREDTALEVGSGSLLVYATPCMAAMMEGAACAAIEEALEKGTTTVGTGLNLRHTAATVAIASGADIKSVQDLLGHATASFTLNVYAHSSDQMKKDTAARMQSYYDNLTAKKA